MSDTRTSLEDLHDDDDNLLDPGLGGGEGDPGSGNPDDGDGNPDGNPEDQAPGIEQFLSQYGISGGMIDFEDGESKHFEDLTPEEQFNVLSDLAASGVPAVEDSYGLEEAEIQLLNVIRQSGGTVEEVINDIALERVSQIMALQESGSLEYSEMSNDAITAKWLQDNNPSASEEELAEELSRLKSGKFYDNNAEKLRSDYVRHQQEDYQKTLEAAQLEDLARLEEDRRVIATAVTGMDNVAGFRVDDQGKNEILGKILEVNQHGDSLFMEEVFSHPEKLFTAAWLYYNADAYLQQLDKQHNRDLANEYQKGKNHALNGLPDEPISGVGGGNRQPSSPAPLRETHGKVVTLEDLHND